MASIPYMSEMKVSILSCRQPIDVAYVHKSTYTCTHFSYSLTQRERKGGIYRITSAHMTIVCVRSLRKFIAQPFPSSHFFYRLYCLSRSFSLSPFLFLVLSFPSIDFMYFLFIYLFVHSFGTWSKWEVATMINHSYSFSFNTQKLGFIQHLFMICYV